MNNLNYLEDAFDEDFDVQQYYEDEIGQIHYNLECSRQDVGLLNVKTGKIVACDPFVCSSDAEPFIYDFPIGKFPVQLAIGKFSYNSDERVALARIKFSEEKPISWQMALVAGQDLKTLKEDEIFGYPVDAGAGCFMDVSAQIILDKYLEKEENFDIISEEIDKTYKHTRYWLLWEKDGENVAMFSSGVGDGYYASYIGYDENNEICRLVTDFDLIYPFES